VQGFRFAVPDWNCRQASFYGLFGILVCLGRRRGVRCEFPSSTATKVTPIYLLKRLTNSPG
jgi:hypothetical protein